MQGVLIIKNFIAKRENSKKEQKYVKITYKKRTYFQKINPYKNVHKYIKIIFT